MVLTTREGKRIMFIFLLMTQKLYKKSCSYNRGLLPKKVALCSTSFCSDGIKYTQMFTFVKTSFVKMQK